MDPREVTCRYVLHLGVPMIRTASDAFSDAWYRYLRAQGSVQFELDDPSLNQGSAVDGSMWVLSEGSDGYRVRVGGNKKWQAVAKRYAMVALVPTLAEPFSEEFEVFTLHKAEPEVAQATPDTSAGESSEELFSASVDLELFQQLLNVRLDPDVGVGEVVKGSLRIAWELEDGDTVDFWVLGGSSRDVSDLEVGIAEFYGE